jgi:hypothetical protein
MTDGWYYIRDGQPVGPVSRAQLVAELRRSPSWHHEHVWKPEYPAWQEAGAVHELFSELVKPASADPAQDHAQHLARGLAHDLAQNDRRKPRQASRLVTVVVYSGLAVLGILSAITYHLLF